MTRRVTVTLTPAQWRALLLAADNGAWSGDIELMETMFPTFAARKSFVTAMQAVNDAVKANYHLPSVDDLRSED